METAIEEVFIKSEIHEDGSPLPATLGTNHDYDENCSQSKELPPQIKQETTRNILPNSQTEALYPVLYITYVDEESSENIANEYPAADVKLEADSDAEDKEFKPIVPESINIKDEVISDLNSDKMTDKCILEPNQFEDKSAEQSPGCRRLQSHRDLYECDVCEFKTVWKTIFRQHLLFHSKFFECDMCDFKATKKENLDLHLQTHSREMPYECSRCGYKAVRRRYVLMHMHHHLGERSSLKCHFVWPKMNDENPYQCNKCSYKAKRKEHLERHWLTHTQNKQIYNCNACKYMTAQKHHLKLHLMAHAAEKPLRCSICGYRTADKGNLTKHIKTHSRMGTFSTSPS